MANPTLAGFRARFPEFNSVADATVQLHLDDAIAHLDETSWGDCYEKAVYLYTAHALVLGLRRAAEFENTGESVGVAGPVTSASADGLSVSYGAGKAAESHGDDWYTKTPYGQEYLAFRDECISGARVASC